jgi:hypothetical protein
MRFDDFTNHLQRCASLHDVGVLDALAKRFACSIGSRNEG